jgi:hypothetical protein
MVGFREHMRQPHCGHHAQAQPFAIAIRREVLVQQAGYAHKYPGAPPIATRFTAYNGPTASSLQAIQTVTYSFVVMADTVPIDTFYQVCITNITSGVVTFNIQQSEFTNDPSFP